MESPFGWPGGKRNLKKILLSVMPQHRAYVEVFAGSAKLLFAKEPAGWEIVNDINDEIVTFFRVAKHRPSELAERLEHDLIAASRFAELKSARASENEIEKALRFVYLTWQSFGCMGDQFAGLTIKQLGKSPRPVKRSFIRIRTLLADVADRLRNVLVENRDFAECIQRYDCAETFFYCDPPYSNFQDNGRYKPLAARNVELFDLLAHIKGKFLLSFDGAPEIRALARKHGFQCRSVQVSYTLAARATKVAPEVLISNYSLKERSRIGRSALLSQQALEG